MGSDIPLPENVGAFEVRKGFSETVVGESPRGRLQLCVKSGLQCWMHRLRSLRRFQTLSEPRKPLAA